MDRGEGLEAVDYDAGAAAPSSLRDGDDAQASGRSGGGGGGGARGRVAARRSDLFEDIDANGDMLLGKEEIRAFITDEVGDEDFDEDGEVEQGLKNVMRQANLHDQGADEVVDKSLSSLDIDLYWKKLGDFMTVAEVTEWVRHAVQLPAEAEAFAENSITGFDLPDLVEDDGRSLREDLGIKSELRLRKLKRAIKMRLLGMGQVPQPPRALVWASNGCDRATLRWLPPATDSGIRVHKYQLQRRADDTHALVAGTADIEDDGDDNEWTNVHTGPATQWVDTGVRHGRQYAYRVTAWNAIGHSQWAEVDGVQPSDFGCPIAAAPAAAGAEGGGAGDGAQAADGDAAPAAAPKQSASAAAAAAAAAAEAPGAGALPGTEPAAAAAGKDGPSANAGSAGGAVAGGAPAAPATQVEPAKAPAAAAAGATHVPGAGAGAAGAVAGRDERPSGHNAPLQGHAQAQAHAGEAVDPAQAAAEPAAASEIPIAPLMFDRPQPGAAGGAAGSAHGHADPATAPPGLTQGHAHPDVAYAGAHGGAQAAYMGHGGAPLPHMPPPPHAQQGRWVTADGQTVHFEPSTGEAGHAPYLAAPHGHDPHAHAVAAAGRAGGGGGGGGGGAAAASHGGESAGRSEPAPEVKGIVSVMADWYGALQGLLTVAALGVWMYRSYYMMGRRKQLQHAGRTLGVTTGSGKPGIGIRRVSSLNGVSRMVSAPGGLGGGLSSMGAARGAAMAPPAAVGRSVSGGSARGGGSPGLPNGRPPVDPRARGVAGGRAGNGHGHPAGNGRPAGGGYSSSGGYTSGGYAGSGYGSDSSGGGGGARPRARGAGSASDGESDGGGRGKGATRKVLRDWFFGNMSRGASPRAGAGSPSGRGPSPPPAQGAFGGYVSGDDGTAALGAGISHPGGDSGVDPAGTYDPMSLTPDPTGLEALNHCVVCRKRFSVMKRRRMHHCSVCTGRFCQKCGATPHPPFTACTIPGHCVCDLCRDGSG